MDYMIDQNIAKTETTMKLACSNDSSSLPAMDRPALSKGVSPTDSWEFHTLPISQGSKRQPSPDLIGPRAGTGLWAHSRTDIGPPIMLIVALALQLSTFSLLFMTNAIKLPPPKNWVSSHLPWGALAISGVSFERDWLLLDHANKKKSIARDVVTAVIRLVLPRYAAGTANNGGVNA